MIQLRNLNRRDLLRLILPYLASLVVIGAVFVIQDSFIRNLGAKVLSVFQSDTEQTAEILAGMAMEESTAGLFHLVPGHGAESPVFEPSPELRLLLGLERAAVVFGAPGSEPQARDSLEDAAVESGHLVSFRTEQGQDGDTGLIRAVYPVMASDGTVTAYSSVTLVEPYSIRWLTTLRYAMLVLFAVVLVLVVFPRMLFDISGLRRQRELDGFDTSPRSGETSGTSPDTAALVTGLLENLDHTMGTASILLSVDGGIIFISPAAQTLFDVSEEDCDGRLFGELPSLSRAGIRSVEKFREHPLDTTLMKSSGEEIPVRLTSFDLDTPDGVLSLITASGTGPSKPWVSHRGGSHRQTPLTGSVAVISAMIRGFTHELNNLLGGILGASSMGERLQDGLERERYRAIIAEATKASRIVRELRESTTPRSGDRGTRIDIRNELSEISEALRGVLPGNTPILFDCNTDAVVEAAGVILRQLVYSLAIGSGKRSRGSFRFRISVSEMSTADATDMLENLKGDAADDGYVVVSLSDGTVIPEETRESFLDPRTDPGRIQEMQGASVATAVQAVQRLGGNISFGSSPHGTVLRLFLRKVSEVGGSRITGGGDRSGQGISVLIAEDVALVRESLHEMLTHLGFIARGVSTGDEALDVLEKTRFDVLMLDLSMPGIPSMDVARTCRTNWPELAIVLTSGYDPGDDVIRAVTDMGIPFIAKPYLPTEVASMIRRAVRKAKDGPTDG